MARKWLMTLLIVVFFVRDLSAQFVQLTSSVQQSGRTRACPGENVTYTCETNGNSLAWLVDPYVTEDNVVTFTRFRPVGELITVVPEAVRRLDSISPTFLSTLFLKPSGDVTNTTVVCRTIGGTSGSLPYTISGVPSPPQNVMVSIVHNGTATVTINIAWDPPEDNGGGDVDSYTVETSPEAVALTVTSRTTIVTLNIPYNERYTLSVRAVNCVGNSTPASTNPIEFVNCSTPSGNPNVTIDPYQTTIEGSVISYQCSPGFIPEGRVMSLCGGDGRWTPDPDHYSCTEVDCGAPLLSANSSVVSGPSLGTKKGSEVTFQCNEGLFPSNEIIIVCTSEERWSPDPEGIVCGEIPESCTLPSVPINGFLDKVSFSNLLFGCNEGYSPQGSMMSQCVAVDSWTPDPAQLECTSTTTTATTTGATCAGPVTAAVVVCSLSFYIGGVLTGLLIYFIIIRCRDKQVSTSTSSSGRSTSAPDTPAPVYEDIVPKGNKEQAGIKLQENVAYGPVKK